MPGSTGRSVALSELTKTKALLKTSPLLTAGWSGRAAAARSVVAAVAAPPCASPSPPPAAGTRPSGSPRSCAPETTSRRSVSSERQHDKTTQQQQRPTATSEGDERRAGDGAHLGALVELLPVVERLLVGSVVQRLVVRRENTPSVVKHQVAVDEVRHDEHDQTHSVQTLPQQRGLSTKAFEKRSSVELLSRRLKWRHAERRAFVLAYPKKA